MARRRRRGRPRGVRLLLLVAAVCILGLLYYRPVRAYMHAHRQLAERSAEVRSLEAKKRTLERQLADSASTESLIRAARRLGLVLPGERLFIVKDIARWRRTHAAGH